MSDKIYYRTEPAGRWIPWPTMYPPQLKVIDEYTLGQPFVQYPMQNGMERIYAIIWENEDGHALHHWASDVGWLMGAPT